MSECYSKNSLNEVSFSKNGMNVKLPENVNYKNISICFVETEKGRENYCLLDESTIFYYIIEGNGEFIINEKKVEVAKNDLIEILPKNKYTYKGNLKMLEILTSEFNEKEVHEF